MGISQPWVLNTDLASPTLRERTEWSFGQTRFNIVFLGVVHKGVAYPSQIGQL